jgi:Zn-dependent peptidase ImmA (M78 family)
MSKTEVPITREVLEWAIEESGFTPAELAEEARIDSDLLMQWVTGDARPGVTELRSLARALRRPFATFLLPTRPKTSRPQVQFRHLPGQDARPLSPVELRYLRKASRLQHMAEWISRELREPPPQIPTVSLVDDPVETAKSMRRRLAITGEEQMAWTSASVAFDAWREAVERLGITVLQLQLGADNCRGFSIWNDAAPVIAVSTAWNDEARTFTLLHELGHLITRTSSACTSGSSVETSGAWDPAERWCERFAAVVLIPGSMATRLIAERFGDSSEVSVATVRWLAGKFRASLRAVAIRLIELGLANWDLYRELPTAGDQKRRGGGGGKGRDRQEIQEDQLGGRALDLFVRAVEADVVSRTEALSYLDVTDSALESLAANRA